ncbi:uncharacterized protein LOC124254837 [Haliotis rubra]|uniref:uncharacterized protein LOC124254837 n=1 Tax=Haliotis rubra TaxID=36100 RepID=UPI001EE60E7D|nr:uncharacterized protein LOC124254837 [Haliotis rubra]
MSKSSRQSQCLLVCAVFALLHLPRVQPACGGNIMRVCDATDTVEASFYMVPQFGADKNITTPITKTRHIFGEKNCQKASSTKTPGSPLCPVHYILNFDAVREPSMIVEAVCTCAYGDGYTHACSPVYYFRPVLEYDRKKQCGRKVIRRFQSGCMSTRVEFAR